MIEAQGPNVEEHLWVDSNVLWMTTKDKHNKGCVRGKPVLLIFIFIDRIFCWFLYYNFISN